jgi:FolB domain-containing protein
VTDRIEIRDVRLEAQVGVLAEEKVGTQPISVDLDLYRPLARAARQDELAATSDYAVVLDAVTVIVATQRFELLETLARRLAEAALAADRGIKSVTVVVERSR